MGGYAFISYVREDEAVVERVQDALEDAGVDVWRDVHDIAPGRRWLEAIAAAMDTKEFVLVACFSASAVEDETSGQRAEIAQAVEVARARGTEPRIIPVRLDACEVPPIDLGDGRSLRDLQWVDLAGDGWEAGITRLVAVVRGVLLPTLAPAEAWRWLPEQAVLDGARRNRRWPGGVPSVPGRRLTGHPSRVTSVVSVPVPSGTLLAVTCFGAVRLWDPATGEPRSELPASPYETVHAACALPLDGQVLLATGGDSQHRVRLWDPVSGEAVGDPFGPTSGQFALCSVPLPDGRVLVACGGDVDNPTVSLWDPATGRQVGASLVGHEALVTCVRAIPVGRRTLLASGSHDSTVRLWDPVTGQPYEQGTWHAARRGDDGVYDLCAVPVGDQTVIAAACGDGHVRFWDVLTGRSVGEPQWGHRGIVLAVCTVPVGGRALVASAGNAGAVRLWDPATGAPIGAPLTGAGPPVASLCVVPLGRETALASGGNDGAVQLWVAPPRTTAPTPTPTAEDVVLRGHAGPVRRLCSTLADDGRAVLASSGDDGTLRFWDVVTGRPHGDPLEVRGGHVAAMCSVRVAGRDLVATVGAGRSGDTGATGAKSATCIQLWDPSTALPSGPPIVTDGASHMCTVPVTDRALLATAGPAGDIAVWDPSTRRSHATFTVGGPLAALCAVPVAGDVALAVVETNGAIRCRTANGDPAGPRFRAGLGLRRAGGITAACVGRSGDRVVLATGDEGGTVRLWDVGTGRPARRPITLRRSPVRSLCAVPTDGGMLLAVGFGDGAVLLADPVSGHRVGEPLDGHGGAVASACVAASAVGPMLATASHDGTIRIWRRSSTRHTRAPSPGPSLLFIEQMRAEVESEQSRAHLRGDIVPWLEEFGRYKAFDSPGWDDVGATVAAIHELWQSRPDAFVEQLDAIATPLGGWAAYGAHQLIWEILSDAASGSAGQALAEVAIHFARSEGLGLAPWEIRLASDLGIIGGDP